MRAVLKNGQAHNGAIDIVNFSLHYGTCIFEGIRSYSKPDGGYSIVELTAHVERLFESAELLKRPITRFSKSQVSEQIIQSVETFHDRNLYIRPMVTYGDSVMGIRNRTPEDIWVLIWPWDIDIYSDRYMTGISLGVSNVRKSNPFPAAKVSSNYLSSFVALNSDDSQSYDDMIMLDTFGFVCETSAHNLFFVSGGELYTPTLRNALAGITRELVIRVGESQGIPTKVCDISVSDIPSFDEVFIVGTASEVVPVRSVGDAIFSSAAENSITTRIHSQLRKAFLEY